MEMVDIVNDTNEVLYQTSKIEAHEKGLLHRCVIAEVINAKGEWLLVQQASDRQDAGKFVSPVGGHVQAGESPESALIRETKEELGIEAATYKFVGQGIFNRVTRGKKENHLFLLYEVMTDQTPTLNHESVAYQYFTRAEVFAMKQNTAIPGDALLFVLNEIYT